MKLRWIYRLWRAFNCSISFGIDVKKLNERSMNLMFSKGSPCTTDAIIGKKFVSIPSDSDPSKLLDRFMPGVKVSIDILTFLLDSCCFLGDWDEFIWKKLLFSISDCILSLLVDLTWDEYLNVFELLLIWEFLFSEFFTSCDSFSWSLSNKRLVPLRGSLKFNSSKVRISLKD